MNYKQEKKIKFGSQPAVTVKKDPRAKHWARDDVKPVGLEANEHTTYAPHVKFENIKVQVNVCRVKEDGADPVGVAKGALLEGVPITIPTNTAAATVQAMKKRCDYAPQLESIEDFKQGHEILMAKIPQLEDIRVDQALMEEYLATCKPSKAARLREQMLEGTWKFDGDTKHVFAKQEVLLKDHRSQPRVVYQGTDMYNMIVGCVVMELTRRMKYTCSLRNPLNTGNKVIFACGASGEELGDIMEGARGEPIESDAKNNDGSQSGQFRKYEAVFYRKHGAPMWFCREFARNVQVKVWTRYGVCGWVKGQRWSGEGTTTTGNSYVHMVLMQASLKQALVEESTNIHGGDDYLGFVEKPAELKTAIESVYKTSGMVAEVVQPKGRHIATFYQKRYVRSTIGTRPVPRFGRVMAKLNLRANKNAEVNDRDYMAGKYLSAAYEHRYVPEIKDLLLSTSSRLSESPFIDAKDTKIIGGNAEFVREKVEEHPTIPTGEFSTFLNDVYGISIEQLSDVYQRVAQSAEDYCDGWTYVDKKTGKFKNKKTNHRYQPTYADGDVVAALVRMDI
jgi:hypothetical protein